MQFGGIAYRNKAMIVLSQDAFSLRFGNIDMLSFDGLLGWDVFPPWILNWMILPMNAKF